MNDIITRLRKLQIELHLDNGKLRVNSPAGVMTAALKDEITAHKEFLIAYLGRMSQKADYSAIRNVEEREYYPMSSAQKRLYLLYEMDKSSAAYNMPQLLRFDKPLDKRKLERVFESLIARHESLRTSFRVVDGSPVQKVEKEAGFRIECVPVADPADEAFTDGFVRPFDLGKAPLFRVRVAEGPLGIGSMIIDAHHIVADGYSFQILRDEFYRLYEGGDLPPLGTRYKDYAYWQNSGLQQRRTREQEDHWLGVLSGTLPVLRLPADHPRLATSENKGGLVGIFLDDGETALIRKCCAEHGLTTSMLLHSLLSILFLKLTGHEDIIIGSSVSGRNRPDLDGIVGMFVNALPLRCFPRHSKPVISFFGEIKASMLEAYDNEDCQFDSLVERLHIKREPGRNPIFDVMLNMADPVDSLVDLSDGRTSVYAHAAGEKRFDMTLNAIEYANALYLQWQYDAQLFEARTAEGFLRYLRNLVSALAGVRERSIGELDIETEETLSAVFGELTGVEVKGEEDDLIPASYHQERLWFIDKFESGYLYAAGPVYHNIPLQIDFDGQLNIEMLREAIQTLARRHRILRTTIVTVGEQPFQRVLKDEVVVQFERIDGETTDIGNLIRKETDVPFELGKLLVRGVLLHRGPRQNTLLLVFHHIVADRYSVARLTEELLSIYIARVQGQEVAVEETGLSYARLSLWQRGSLRRLEPYFLSYWRSYLGGDLRPIELPADRPRAAIHIYRAALLDLAIPEDLVKKIKAFQHEEKWGVDVILMAAFKVLLSKYARQEEVVIGVDVDNRGGRMPEGMIGPAANLIVLRSFIRAGMSFKDYLRQLQEGYHRGCKYGYMPFDKLVQELAPAKDMSRTALFDILYRYEEKETYGPETADLKVTIGEMNAGYGKYDLNLLLTGDGDQIRGKLAYNAEYFEADTVFLWLESYVELIGNLLADPGQDIATVDLLSEKERYRLLHELNYGAVDYPRDKTVTDLFEEQVGRTPDNIAIQFEGDVLSYGALNDLANRLAVLLRKKGVAAGDLVGLFMDRSIGTVAGMLAILKAGAGYLPIDVEYPDGRIGYMIKDSGIGVVLTTRAYAERVSAGIQVVCMEEMEEISSGTPAPDGLRRPSDLCYVIYTSGTTGNPKGVMIEHGNVVRLLFNDRFQFDFGSTDVWTMFHSHCFDFSVWEMYGALLYGGKVIVIPRMVARDTGAFWRILVEEKVTVLNQTPSAFYNLIREDIADPGIAPALRYVIFGGEALSPGKLKAWRASYPRVRLINMYGITETTVHVTYKEIGDYEIEQNTSNMGRPIPTLSVYLFDERQRLVPRGVAGELYVGGAGVSRGYLGNEVLTNKKFLANPYNAGERLYRSGDLARLCVSGDLEYIGRIDDQVKIRGFRIELGEIESQLIRCERVKDVIVVVRERDGEKYLAAYYVAQGDLTSSDLRNFLSDKLPEYMLPSYYVALKSIPVTANGKADRKALPDPEPGLTEEYRAPADRWEIKLAEIWSEVLKMPADRISSNRSFFELGGHSLRAALLVNKINKELHSGLSLKDIFIHQDISGLAKFLRGVESKDYAAIPAAEEKEYYRMSSAQKRLYFLWEFDRSSLAYNMPHLVRLTGQIDRARLKRAFELLQDRHAILRTSFRLVNDEPMQFIAGRVDADVDYFSAAEADRFTRPFDLGVAPLVRAGLFEAGRGEHILMVDMHHIISDGVSQGIFFKELMCFYNNEELDGGGLQYKDYAEWQWSPGRRRAMAARKDFWMKELAEDPGPLPIPTDLPRPPIKTYGGDAIHFELSAEETEELKGMAEWEEATLFMLVLAVYTILLSKLTGSDDIVVGTPVAAREHPDLESLLGMFVNTIPLRNRVSGQSTFREFLSAVRARSVLCFDNQAYPYEELVDELKVVRDASRNPLFDALLVFDNFEEYAYTIPGLSLRSERGDEKIAKFDLTLKVRESEGRLSLSLEYSTALFTKETIERSARYFRNIVRAILKGGGIKIDDIELTTDEERQLLLTGFNQTHRDYPKHKTIMDMFGEQAVRTPDLAAVRYRGEAITYRELDERSNRIAGYLRTVKGVKTGDLVGILLSRDEHLIPFIYGILKAGAAYVPVDREHPAARVAAIVADAGLKLLITRAAHPADAAGLSCAVLEIDSELEVITRHPAGAVAETDKPGGHDLAYVIYTSGSTGQPKGVMIEHHSVVNRILWMQKEFPLTENDVLLQKTPVVFDVSVWELFWWAVTGASLSLLEQGGEKDPAVIVDAIKRDGVTTMHFVPSMLGAFLSGMDAYPGLPELRTLKRVFTSGEALKPEQVELFGRSVHERWNTRLINLYGPTEATVDVSWYECGFDRNAAAIPIGRPIANTRLYIVDSSGHPAPIGVPGELYIAGVGLARGYLNNPALTGEKFIRHPAVPEERVYRTGDWARWLADGDIEFLGRMDNQVKIRGFRIELGEIEYQLAQLDGVLESVVIIRERNGSDYLAAYYTAKTDLGSVELKEQLAVRLPSYMLPTYFVRVDAMPVTANGKLNRKAFPEPEMEREPGILRPVNEMQRVLAEIWAGVLGVDAGSVGTNMNFFDIGGDSLKLIKVVNRIRRQLGKEIAVTDLFKHPMISALAQYLKSAGKEEPKAAAPGIEEGVAQMNEAFELFNQLRR